MKQIINQICISLGCKGDRHIKNKDAFQEHQVLGHQIMHEEIFIQELQTFMENRQITFINYSTNKLKEILSDYEQKFNQNIKEFIDDSFELIQRDIINNSKEELDINSISEQIQNKESLDDLVEMFNGSQNKPLIKTNQLKFQISQIEIKLQRLEIQLSSTLSEHLNLILHLQQSQPQQLSNKINKQSYSNTGNVTNIKQQKKSTIIQRSNIQRNIQSNIQEQASIETVRKLEVNDSFIQLNNYQSESNTEQNPLHFPQNGKDREIEMDNHDQKLQIKEIFEKTKLNSTNLVQEQQVPQTENLNDKEQSFLEKNQYKSELTQDQQNTTIQSLVSQNLNTNIQQMPLKGYKNHDYNQLSSATQKQQIDAPGYNYLKDNLNQQQSQAQYILEQSQNEKSQITLNENRERYKQERSYSLGEAKNQEVNNLKSIFDLQNQVIQQMPLKGYKQLNYNGQCSVLQKQTFDLDYECNNFSNLNDKSNYQYQQQQQQQQQYQQQQQQQVHHQTHLPLKGYKNHNYTQSCRNLQDSKVSISFQNQNIIDQQKQDQNALLNTKSVAFSENPNFIEKRNIQKNEKKIQQNGINYQVQNISNQKVENLITGQRFNVQNSDYSVQYKNQFKTATFQDLSFTTINVLFSINQNAVVSLNIIGNPQNCALKLGIIDKKSFTIQSLLGSMKGIYCIDKDGSLFIEGEKIKQIQDHNIVPNLRMDIKYVSQTGALSFSYENKTVNTLIQLSNVFR